MKRTPIIGLFVVCVIYAVYSQTVIPARPNVQRTATTVSKEPVQSTSSKTTKNTTEKVGETDQTMMEYPSSDINPALQSDWDQQKALNLKMPENIRTTIEYDPSSNTYFVVTKLGNDLISTPIALTQNEYTKLLDKQSSTAFWKEKNQIDYTKKQSGFSLTDMQFDIGMGEKIFGEGGVRVRTQGSVETKFGLKTNRVNNPSLSENARNRTQFDFDQNIEMSVNGKVGDKIDVNMNYNTQSTFDFDAKSIKLKYAGKEDDIIKNLQAGNVSMPINSSLITGGSSLFGIKTDLQFGRLNLAAVVSQQKAQTKSANLNKGVQSTEFELKSDAYEANRHYFLSHFFKQNYNQWIKELPHISSGLVIKKVELWVINKKIQLDNSRNIFAFTDLGEPDVISNPYWAATGLSIPSNNSNTLYRELLGQYVAARDLNQSNQVIQELDNQGVSIGRDFERLESARKLEPTEYYLNPTLGYISLQSELTNDEILAVSFEYSYNGKSYQVGEFSTDGIESPSSLFVKLLKGSDFAPGVPTWDLMMKNVYNVGGYNLEAEKFDLEIAYQNDSVGTEIPYLTEGKVKNQLLLRVMGFDKLNERKQPYPDGIMDYIEGYTVQSQYGRIIFPVLEPFGSDLRAAIGDDQLADKYVFEELYDSSLTVAQLMTEKNKFLIKGSYKSSSKATISLNAYHIEPGSVTVTAGGRKLTENSDYAVDYSSGTVTILDESLLASGTPIQATCEDQSVYGIMRKTMLGMTADYRVNDHFNVGATVMRLSEAPLSNKVDMGMESVNNTIWGLNTAFDFKSQFLTNLLDKLPFVQATQPSQFSFKGEVAQLIAGSSKTLDDKSYVDDFEAAKKTISLKDVNQWTLASTPYDPTNLYFPESKLSNNLDYGKNRSLISWYIIDHLFNQTGTSQTPAHLRGDNDQLSNHFVRTIQEKELFPNRQKTLQQSNLLTVMNLAFYPKERGPYNFDVQGMDQNGFLTEPEKRWGGIMRRIESGYTNFESNNIEYIEFWLMDPFVYDSTGNALGGTLYFNLGDISEDVLKDGRRSFENGLTTNPKDSVFVQKTVWGKVSSRTASVYAFDNTEGVRDAQDVGLDGLTSEEEKNWPHFSAYISGIRDQVSAATYQRMQNDPFSPLNDPSGDDYHYFRGADYDSRKAGILERYKRYNGTEGNSVSPELSGEKYATARTSLPDVEDINADFTLNETERYYQYEVQIKPTDLQVGKNHVTDKRTTTVGLKNGKTATISWYQFKIPIREYTQKVGMINGFNNIRFIRMFLKGFQDSVILRMASLDLVRGDWRGYQKDLYTVLPSTDAKLDLSTVSMEENSGRTPINYKLPPGETRETDPNQPGVFLKDEQSLVLKVSQLSPADARGIYKNASYDFRQYEKLQMFVHAEALVGDLNPPRDKELTLFLRIGSDNQNNYYEYEVPLVLSPHFVNTSNSIWPSENFFDIAFHKLTALKTQRNARGLSMSSAYSAYDQDRIENKIKVLGNPSLSDVKTLMIGVRNNGNTVRSAEIWVNELRLSGFNESGGWAATGNASISLSDLGKINAGGRFVSNGFGGLEQNISERSLMDMGQYNVSMNLNMGKLFSDKLQVNFPVNISVSNQQSTPKYDPLNEDLLMKEVLKATSGSAKKDSILHYSRDVVTHKSIGFNDIRIGIKSKTPLPIDPANFSIRYVNSESNERNAATEYAITRRYEGGVSYAYASPINPWQPFSKAKGMDAASLKLLKEMRIELLPSSLSANSNLLRDYFEKQSRDLASSSGQIALPLIVSKSFLWNSDLNLNWNLTKNIRLKYAINNKSLVEETATSPVNKDRFATEYQHWKDTVTRSLKEFGTPLYYLQTTSLNWMIPTQQIPLIDFLNNTSLQYNATYDWNKSATTSTQTQLGNTISNRRTLAFNTTADLLKLYNKSPFLASVNKKSEMVIVNTPQQSDLASGAKVQDKPKLQLKKFEMSGKYPTDSTIVFKHQLKNKRVYVVAKDSSDRMVEVRMRVKDENNVSIRFPNSGVWKITVMQKEPLEDQAWYQWTSKISRMAMSVRNISVNYTQNDAMSVPGFKPETSLFGSKSSGLAPGWDFALGLQGTDYLEKAMRKNWLLSDSMIVSPSNSSQSKDLTIKALVEPFRNFKIDLIAERSLSNRSQVQYMFEGMPRSVNGSFSMSTLALATAFESPRAKNGYRSKTFERFLSNRQYVQQKLEQRMAGMVYPDVDAISPAYRGQTFDPSIGTYSQYSGDVLIPAFFAAYTGRSVEKSGLNIFPALSQLIPNWSIRYDGLSSLPFFKRTFKNFSLKHGYSCSYDINSFSSYSTWIGASNGMGFIQDVKNQSPIPSSIYDVGNVQLMEKFNPLFEVQATMLNGWTFRTDMSKTRTILLSISGGQIVESKSDQFSFGTGYKISNFRPWGFLSESKIKNDLALTANVSYRNMFSLLRKLKDSYNQATSGNKTFSMELQGDYTISKNLSLSMFYDIESSVPLVSSYPIFSSDFGISMRFTLNR